MLHFSGRLGQAGLSCRKCQSTINLLCNQVKVWSRRCLPVNASAPILDSEPPQQRKKRFTTNSKPKPAEPTAGRQVVASSRQTGKPSGDDSNKERLSKVMAAAGVAARRQSEKLIEQGVVKVNNGRVSAGFNHNHKFRNEVNGQVVTSQVLVDPNSDIIEVHGKRIVTNQLRQKLYYFVVNKPKGYICSNTEAEGREGGKRVVDLLQPWLDAWVKNTQNKAILPPRLFTVGRLDVATTGLIFITNDGQWANKVIHPSADISKEYLLLVDKAPSKVQLETMMKGVVIDGVHVAPEEVATLEESTRLRVVVKEGKKHEGKRKEGASSSYHRNQPATDNDTTLPYNNRDHKQHDKYDWGRRQDQPAGISCYDSERFVVQSLGARLWVWSTPAWAASLAFSSRNRASLRRIHHLYDPVTGESWQAGDHTKVRLRGRYKSGLPKRAPIARWWKEQPNKPSPTPPNVLSLSQWRASASLQSSSANLWSSTRSIGTATDQTASDSLIGINGSEPQFDDADWLSNEELDLVHKEENDWQVRVLASNAGLEVLSLKRVRVGGYRLPRTLKLGEYLALTPNQIKTVTDKRAEDIAKAKESYQQRAPPKNNKGIPDPETLAAIIDGKEPSKNTAPRPRPRSQRFD